MLGGLGWGTIAIIAIVVISTILPVWFGWRMLKSAGIFGNLAFRDAPIGIGTITAVQRTGMMVNYQPQLQINMTAQTADGHIFDSTARQVVDLVQLSSIVPGAALPVRYLPGRTDLVEIDRSGDSAQAQAVLNEVRKRSGLVTDHELDIATRGVPTNAVVTAVRPTGQIVHGNPRMSIMLMVNRPDGSAYETTVEKIIPAQLVGYIQVGRVIDVHFLPGYEMDVVLSLPANQRS